MTGNIYKLMRNRAGLSGLALALVCGLATPARAQESQLQLGDVANGKQLYRLHCARCHGFAGDGRGPAASLLPRRAANHRDGGLMNARDDAALHRVIGGGCRVAGCQGPMPGFADVLGELDVWDLVAYLRTLHLSLRQLFPKVDQYLAKRYTIGGIGPKEFRQGQKERLRRRVGKVAEKDLEQVVFTLFRSETPRHSPELVPQQPRRLAELKKDNKVGYVFFMTMRDPRGRRVPVTLALDKQFSIRALVPTPLDAGLGKELEKRLKRYLGLGHRGDDPKFKTSRDRVGKALDAEVTRLYALAVEAANAYEHEENERSWADGSF